MKAPPEGGKPLIHPLPADVSKLAFHCSASIEHDSEILDSKNAAFNEYLRAEIYGQGRNTWDAGISIATTEPVSKGDSILIGLWLRGTALSNDRKPIDGRGGIAEVVFEMRSPPHSKSTQYLIETDGTQDWKHYYIRCESLGDYSAGESGLSLQLGYIAQRIEVGGVEIFNYGDRPLGELPAAPLTYVGREADAAWRGAALQRIEKIRKCDSKLRIEDGNGRPLANTDIRIKQIRHDFNFGSAVNVGTYRRQDADGQRYRDVVKDRFTIATVENALKWSRWDSVDQSDRDHAIEMMADLKRSGLTIRGHVLVWPGYGNSPSWVSQLEGQPQAFERTIATHIREMGYATRHLTDQWDVVNESFDNTDFERVLGKEILAKSFVTANEVMPGVELYYNDYAGLAQAGLPTGHKDHFVETCKYLASNSPIDGIGIQGHFGKLLTPPERMIEELIAMKNLAWMYQSPSMTFRSTIPICKRISPVTF